ncbi:MAG: glutamate--cysteine ligase [Gammaproteobacteria bacterium]|nr:glutamate--cysteine ligase [Gammaproteobacteria bacterium]
MDKQFEERLAYFSQTDIVNTFKQIRRGIEKESLRVTSTGLISQKDHPHDLGSALENPYITTDYSEALLEFITPAYDEPKKPIDVLDQIHRFVYQNLEDEVLWGASMPCAMKDEASILISKYGTSHSGKMKEIYRRGLGHRYGRFMQTIAGVHYNFSLPESFWQHLQHFEGGTNKSSKYFISDEYMGLIRNFLRTSWIIPYLFGASPAICESFLQGKKSKLDQLVPGTVYGPYATSLRLGDLGYSNNAQANMDITYNCIDGYIKGLEHAIQTPEPFYEKIGVIEDGEYRQLNANLLQIENEYYSNVRPKRVTLPGERPTKGLRRAGIEYVEVRALDLNIFDPVGISYEQSQFIDCLLIHNVLTSSPAITAREEPEIQENKRRVVDYGRHPDLRLIHDNREISMHRWANNLFSELKLVAKMMDSSGNSSNYTKTIENLSKWIEQPEMTFSGRIVDEIKTRGDGFFQFAMDYSKQHADYFKQKPLSENDQKCFVDAAKASHLRQLELEKPTGQSFEEFLAAYFE